MSSTSGLNPLPTRRVRGAGRWQPVCPCCGGTIERITRRWGDRLISLWWPLRRFRCEDPRCGWQGNLRRS